MIEFSINQPDKNKEYFKRPGAYGFIKNSEGLLAIVKTQTGYFLPGGGVEKEESLADCLKRECLEEIGADISVLDNFAYGTYYFYSTTLNIDMESQGHFFICEINNFSGLKTEDDHELVWLPLEEAISLLYLDNQREAIKIFRDLNL